MILKSSLPDVVLSKESFNVFILQLMRKFGDEVAIIEDDTGNTITFKQIYDYSFNCACAFTALGIKKGDVIATYFSNCAAFSFIIIGAAACGAIVTTCNPNYTEGEVKSQFVNSQPKLVIVEAKDYTKMSHVARDIQSIKHIFSIDKNAECETIYDLIAHADLKDYPFDTSVDLEETLLLPYSSGTTGLPKGVMLTHGNLIAMTEISRVILGASKTDVMLVFLPMFHVYGILMMLSCLALGSKLILGKRFTVEGCFKTMQDHKVTIAPLVPPMILGIYNSPLLSKYNLSLKKVLSGAAPLPESMADEVQKKLNIHLYQGWGLSEGLPVTCGALDRNTPIRSIGSLVPNNLLKVVDPETGKELGRLEHGELCVKGPLVMKGYYKNPQATLNCIDSERWFHTGDIGYYDKNGYIYIVDRLKELIKYKGFQVAPAELEELLLRHPKISDAAVIGIPDREAGEVPKAFLVRTDQYITEKDIHVFLNGKVTSYKYLRGGVEFRDSIPKSPSGKILRKELRAQEAKSKL